MVKKSSFKKSNLPSSLRYLDIDNLLLLPSGECTIELSKAKHLKLVDEVIRNPLRMIAVVPIYEGKFISDIACAGRIVSFSEEEDDTYLITIAGICRFHIDILTSENNSNNKITPIWYEFLDDLDLNTQKIKNRENLNNMVFNYFNIHKKYDLEFSKIQEISDTQIISLLTSKLEYNSNKKEQLIKAKNLTDISNILHQIMEVHVAEYESATSVKH